MNKSEQSLPTKVKLSNWLPQHLQHICASPTLDAHAGALLLFRINIWSILSFIVGEKVLISRTALKLISLEMLIRWEWNVMNQKKKTRSFFFFHVITVIIIIIISFGWYSSSSIDPTHPSVNSSLVCKLHITYSWSHINFTSTKWNWNLNESEKNSTLVWNFFSNSSQNPGK